MSVYQILAILLTVTAIGGYVNYRFMKLPETVGHMVFSLLLSLCLVFLGKLGFLDLDRVREIVSQVDFSDVLLHGMLSFLLFAGALHININDLRILRVPVAILATGGVVIATFLIGTLFWLICGGLGFNLPYIYALLFGALISPTDPIAVLGILKKANAGPSLSTKIGGESLFNDGIGVVVFLSILGLATGVSEPSIGDITLSLLREAVGGASLGFVLGWGVYRLLRRVDDAKVELLMTLALAMGGYALAELVHFSAPICMVVAGLLIGNHGRMFSMSSRTRERLDTFWELLDEVMNAVLFMMIGFEVIVINMYFGTIVLGLATVVAVLIGRFVSVGIPMTVIRRWYTFGPGVVRLMTWGGLRGGISIAMALALPHGHEKEIILPVTYIVVLFSIVVQGLTFSQLIEYLRREEGQQQGKSVSGDKKAAVQE